MVVRKYDTLNAQQQIYMKEELNASGFGQNRQDVEMTEQRTDKDENSNFRFGASAIGH